ncbi:MAG: choice-of-anchor I family protein [Actinomycetota bacterium]
MNRRMAKVVAMGLVALISVSATAVGPAGAATGEAEVAMSAGASSSGIHLEPVGTINASIGTAGGAEIVAFDPASKRAFTSNGAGNRIDVIDLTDPSAPALLAPIDLASLGSDVQSVAAQDGIVAAVLKPLSAHPTQDPGKVAFFNSAGQFLRQATVGSLPDAVTFTEDGRHVLVANEGEPRCSGSVTADNPEGSISIVNVATGAVRTADFKQFNRLRSYLTGIGVRLNWPGATVAQDLEPEYIATKGNLAWVSLQENNAIAIVNIATARVLVITPLGSKRHDVAGQGLDPSDRDSASNGKSVAIVERPVDGLYMPDGIAVTSSALLVTANEGDARDYSCFSDESRVSALGSALDPADYSGAILGNGPAGMGRLTVSRTDGDLDGDGKIDRLKAFGARSFSIRNAAGTLLYDSGDRLEQLFAQDPALRPFFNSDGESNDPASAQDSRSDNKGPEPESVVVGTVAGKELAFIGLERVGGVAVFDLTNPFNPAFVDYANPRIEGPSILTTDRAPEGLKFVPASQSPNGVPLLLVANEVSGNTRIYEVRS